MRRIFEDGVIGVCTIPLNFNRIFFKIKFKSSHIMEKDEGGPVVKTTTQVKATRRRKKFVGRSKSSKSEGAVSKSM